MIRTQRAARAARRDAEERKGRNQVWKMVMGVVVMLLIIVFLFPRLANLFSWIKSSSPARQEQVSKIYGEAEESRNAAVSMKQEYEARLASAREEADGLVLFGGVEAAGESMQEASERCEQAAEAVRQAFAPYGEVEEESSCAWPCGSSGYTAEHTFRFSCEDAGKAAELCRVLAEAGLRHIRALPVCRGEGMYGELLTAALQDATEKAQALGASGEPVRVEEFCCCRGEEGSLLLEARVRAVWVE